jgi:hypothetical protein
MLGAPIKVVQELLGRATIDMTTRYSHLSPAARQEAIKLLDLPANDSAVATGGRSGYGREESLAVTAG